MRARSATAAGVLSLAATAAATGSAIINNNCAHDVYLWPVSVDESPASATVIKANGGTWSQQYKTCSSGGMSLKLSATDDISEGITQFEYTLGGGTIWYDISNVNCLPFGSGTCPFGATGMSLTSGSGCPTAICDAGNATCHAAYTYPDDNWASLSCEPNADTTLDLCTSGSSGSSGSAGGLIGQVTSAVGALIGGGSPSTEAAPSTTSTSSTTSTTSSPPPAPTTSTSTTPTTSSTPATSAAPTTSSTTSVEAKPSPKWSAPHVEGGAAYNSNGEVAVAGATSEQSHAAPAPSTTATPTTSSQVQTTLSTVALTTTAAGHPNVVYVYETATEIVATTTVVYEHAMAHKAKRDSAHRHARRHGHHHE